MTKQHRGDKEKKETVCQEKIFIEIILFSGEKKKLFFMGRWSLSVCVSPSVLL